MPGGGGLHGCGVTVKVGVTVAVGCVVTKVVGIGVTVGVAVGVPPGGYPVHPAQAIKSPSTRQINAKTTNFFSIISILQFSGHDSIDPPVLPILYNLYIANNRVSYPEII
jgi:hypothetical protein